MANQRVEYQDMIDLDGYRKAVADSRSDYKAFADDVVRLNELMQKSAQQIRTELESLAKVNAQNDNSRTQEAVGQRAAQLIAQYRDQKAAVDALNKVNAQLDQVTGSLLERQTQLLTQYASVEGNTKKDIDLRRKLANEIVNLQAQFDKLDKSTRANLGGTKEVIGQYNLLQQELSDARKELKSLDDAFDSNTGKLNKNNAAAVALSQRINVADTALKKMDQGMGQYNRYIGQYENAVQGLVSGGFTGLLGSLGLIGIAFAKVVEVGGAALDKMSQFEQIRGGLRGVTKDSDELAHSQEFLEQIADRLGVSYEKLAQSYRGMKASTKGTPLEGAETDRIFKAFTTRLAELKAPASQVESALLAVEQMMTKTTVQSQELHLQLSQALPGSIKLFADALGVSTQELSKMMEKGEVLAADVLPKVADELERTFSGAATDNVNQLTGATARLENQTGLLLDQFNQTFGITKFFAKVKNEIADTLSAMRMAVKNGDWLSFFNSLGALTNPLPLLGIEQAEKDPAIAINKQIEEFKALSSKLREAKLKNVTEAKSNALQTAKTTDDKAERDKALTLYKQYSEELLRLQRANLQVSAQERKQARIDEAVSDKKYHEDRVAGVVKEAKDMSLAQRNARIGDYKKQIASDQAKLKDNPELATSLNRDIAYAKEFIAAIQGVNKELAKKDAAEAKRQAKANTAEAKAAAAKQLQEAKTSLSDSLSVSSSTTNAQLSTLSGQKEDGTIDEKKYVIDRYNITLAGITQRRALLNDAHNREIIDEKEFNKQIEALNAEIAKAGADYLKGKADDQERTFKKALEATKAAITSDNKEIEANLKTRLADIATAYDKQRVLISQSVADRKITEAQGEEQTHKLQLQHIDDVSTAIKAAADTEEQLAKNRVATLKSTANTEIQNSEAVAVETKSIDDAENKRKDANAQADIDRSNKVTDTQLTNSRKVADVNKQIDQKKWEIAQTAMAGFFDVTSSYRQNEIAALEKQKEAELAIAGDNATAKANIEQKFDEKSRVLKRRQAVSDKAAALFQIALSTAEGAIGAAKDPLTLPLVPFIIALGAVQAGIVAARAIPEFWAGKAEGNAYEGPAWVGERGFELIESKQGGKPYYRLAAQKQIMYLNAHDRVYTHAESKRMVEINNQIAHEVRSAPGGSLYQSPVIKAGASASELQQAFEAALDNRPVQEMHWDEKGYREAQRKANSHRTWMENYFRLPPKKH